MNELLIIGVVLSSVMSGTMIFFGALRMMLGSWRMVKQFTLNRYDEKGELIE